MWLPRLLPSRQPFATPKAEPELAALGDHQPTNRPRVTLTSAGVRSLGREAAGFTGADRARGRADAHGDLGAFAGVRLQGVVRRGIDVGPHFTRDGFLTVVGQRDYVPIARARVARAGGD